MDSHESNPGCDYVLTFFIHGMIEEVGDLRNTPEKIEMILFLLAHHMGLDYSEVIFTPSKTWLGKLVRTEFPLFLKQFIEKVYFSLKTYKRSKNARRLMLDGDITATEYKEIKIEIETPFTNSTRELNKISNTLLNLESKIDVCIELLSNIENLFLQRDTATKQGVVGSIFPRNMLFEKKNSSNPRNESSVLSYTQRWQDFWRE